MPIAAQVISRSEVITDASHRAKVNRAVFSEGKMA